MPKRHALRHPSTTGATHESASLRCLNRLNPKRSSSPAIEEKVENDNLGRKSGKGFYDYADDGDGVDYQPEDAGNYDTLRTEAVMINKAAWLIGNDVATPEEIDIGLRLGGSFPEGMCRRGDRLGLDIVLEKLESLYDEYGAERYEPADYLVELVEEGWTAASMAP